MQELENPRTKEEVISERCVIKFKSSNFLINFINSNISNINEEKEDALKTIEKFHPY